MSIETLIPFVVKHNSLIVQALVSLILFLVMVMAYRNFVRAKRLEEVGPQGSGTDLGHLEETLKKLLEKANQVPSAVSVTASGGGEASSALAAEIENLRKSLQEKQDQIEELKNAPATVAAAASDAVAPVATMSNEEKDGLSAQIRELQAKLSEYEIISEDIADLSRYKDENSKLQKELADLKAGGAASMAAVVEAATPTPAAEPVVEEAPAALATAVTVETMRPDPASVLNADDELIKEFAEAVNAQSPAPVGSDDTEKRILKNMEALKTDATAIDESAASSLFDVDRMTAEAGELQASVAGAPEISAAEALGESLDPEKIAMEAAKMEGIKPEDAKLMGEFENFIKKGGNG